MERSVALQKLRKILGDKVGYQINKNAPTPEEREEAKALLKAATDISNALSEKVQARHKAILEADDEYQDLSRASREARKKRDELLGISHLYKITVGTSDSLFFHVAAEGDSWEEIFEKLARRKK